MDHRLATVGQRFIILAESTVLAEPAEGALDDPTLGKHDELAHLRALHNLDHTPIHLLGYIHERASVAAIGPDQLDPTEAADHFCKHQLPAVAVLNISTMDDHGQDQPERVNDNMPLSAGDFLARVITVGPPFWGAAVFTDWLSITAALGVGFLPTLRRTFSRSLS